MGKIGAEKHLRLIVLGIVVAESATAIERNVGAGSKCMFSAHPAVPRGFGEAVDVGAQTGICTVADGGIGTEGHEERQPCTVHEVQTTDRHQVADIVKTAQFLTAGYDGISHFPAKEVQAKQIIATDRIEVETLVMQFLQLFEPIVARHSVTVFREGVDVAHIFLKEVLPRILFTG